MNNSVGQRTLAKFSFPVLSFVHRIVFYILPFLPFLSLHLTSLFSAFSLSRLFHSTPLSLSLSFSSLFLVFSVHFFCFYLLVHLFPGLFISFLYFFFLSCLLWPSSIFSLSCLFVYLVNRDHRFDYASRLIHFLKDV